jgi:hypothetical protein
MYSEAKATTIYCTCMLVFQFRMNYSMSSSTKVVSLNVGGQHFTTTAATLTSPQAAGSMLARLVALHLEQDACNGALDESPARMAPSLSVPGMPGTLFIDRDGSMFAYILTYLR